MRRKEASAQRQPKNAHKPLLPLQCWPYTTGFHILYLMWLSFNSHCSVAAKAPSLQDAHGAVESAHCWCQAGGVVIVTKICWRVLFLTAIHECPTTDSDTNIIHLPQTTSQTWEVDMATWFISPGRLLKLRKSQFISHTSQDEVCQRSTSYFHKLI